MLFDLLTDEWNLKERKSFEDFIIKYIYAVNDN